MSLTKIKCWVCAGFALGMRWKCWVHAGSMLGFCRVPELSQNENAGICWVYAGIALGSRWDAKCENIKMLDFAGFMLE